MKVEVELKTRLSARLQRFLVLAEVIHVGGAEVVGRIGPTLAARFAAVSVDLLEVRRQCDGTSGVRWIELDLKSEAAEVVEAMAAAIGAAGTARPTLH